MRAGDVGAVQGHRGGRASWQRARDVADRLPADEPNKIAMQIGHATALCASTFRFSGSVEDAGYDELRELCLAAGDDLSLAFAMAGMLTVLHLPQSISARPRVSPSECSTLVESMGDPDFDA